MTVNPLGPGQPQPAWTGNLRWEAEANDAANDVLRHNAQELRDESERIAKRAKSRSVSPDYVQQASNHLALHSPSAGADVQMAVGGVLLGVAGGFGAALLITPVHIVLWVGVLAIIIGVLGTAMFSIGCALKMMKR